MEKKVILKTHDVSVRILALAPKEITPWHYHREVVDNIFCLSGTMAIHFEDPEKDLFLRQAQHCEILNGIVHRVENLEDQESRYLIIQGVGEYDFNIVNK